VAHDEARVPNDAAMGHSGYGRFPGDLYETEPWVWTYSTSPPLLYEARAHLAAALDRRVHGLPTPQLCVIHMGLLLSRHGPHPAVGEKGRNS
jgi:hypothetical protein